MKKFIELFTEDGLFEQHHEAFMPTHVFYQMVNHYADRLGDAQREMLMALFQNVEIALHLSKRRQLELAKETFENLEDQKFEYPEYIRNGSLSMITAVVAYYEYVCGHSEEAIRLLEVAAGHSMLQSIDYPYMITGSQEQWRNIVVVRSRQGDLNGALSDLNGLLAFSLTGDIRGLGVEERFHCHAGEDIYNAYWKLDGGVHHGMLVSIIDSSFRGIFELANHDFALAGNFYGQIICNVASVIQGRRVVERARSPIMLLHLYYTGQRELFVEGISGQFDEMRHAAPGLLWLILSNYVILSREAGFELESHPNYQRFCEAYANLEFPTDLMRPPAVRENYAAAVAEK